MCKANFAVCVKVILPCRPGCVIGNLYFCVGWYSLCRSFYLDTFAIVYIIIFTYHGQGRSQIGRAASSGYPQPPSGVSHLSVISKQRLFRCPGPYPDQVRDAAPGGYRKHADQPGCSGVRFFPAILLSSPHRFSPGRPRWPDPAETRPPGGSQVEPGSPPVPRSTPRRGPLARLAGVGPANWRTLCHSGASSQRRTRLGAPAKKTTVSGERPTGSSASDNLAARYEELRRHVLANSGRGTGLFVFLRQGMRAWIEAGTGLAPATLVSTPTRSGSAAFPPPVRADVVFALAAMVLSNRLERHRGL
jgi:hypothetical protein